MCIYLEYMEYVFFIIPDFEYILDNTVQTVPETCFIILCILSIPSKCARSFRATTLFDFKLQ